jgi:DNA-binding NtrC family response regulator
MANSHLERRGGEMVAIDLALVICDQKEDREKSVAALLKCGLSPICCANLQEARMLLPQEIFRVVLCKDFLTDGDFRSIVREAKQSSDQPPVIVLSHSTDWDSYLKALGAGAYDYLVCPPNAMEAERIIWLALAETVDAEKASCAVA